MTIGNFILRLRSFQRPSMKHSAHAISNDNSILASGVGGVQPALLQTSLAFILGFYIIYFGFSDSNPLRQVIYSLPILMAFEMFIRRKLLLNIKALYLFLAYVSLWGSTSILIGGEGVKEVAFAANSLLVASLFFVTPLWFAPYLILIGLLTIILRVVLDSASFGAVVSIIGSAKVGTETSLGLIVPLAVIVTFARGRMMWTLLGLLVTALMFKRIAIVAVVLVLLLDFLQFTVFRNSRFGRGVVMATRLGLLIAALLMGLLPRQFYELLSEYAFMITGNYFSPDNLSSGRYNAMSIFIDNLRSTSTDINWIFGHGGGFSTSFLNASNYFLGKNYPLLHNDILRLFSDYGLIGLGLGIALFVKMIFGNRIQTAFSTYTILLFVTDNVMTYFVYWLVFIALLRSPEDYSVRPSTRALTRL